MAFWFLVCSFLQKGISMLTTPIFTRIMTDAEFGRYSIYLSWSGIITVIATLSISGNCYTRGLVVNDDIRGRNSFTSALLGLLTITVSIVFSFYFIFHEAINQYTGLNTYLFVLMFADMLLVSASQFWTNERRVRYDYKGIVILTLLLVALRPAIAIIAVLYVPQELQVEARITAVFVVNILLFLWIYISIFSKGKRFFQKRDWKYAITFCIPLIPHYLSKTVLNESDRIMIGHYCGSSYAAYYSIAYTIAGVMTIFNSAVAQSLDPWIYQSIKEKKLDRIGPVSYGISAAIAAINFVVMAIAPEALAILAPENYSEALSAIPPVTASVFFTFMYDLFASFQFYFKKTTWIAIGSCGGAVLNIVLNVIFIPKYGFVAAGYTTLFCYAVFGILHYFFMRRVCRQYLDGYCVYDWKTIFGIGFALTALGGIMLLLYPYVWPRYLIVAAVVAVGFAFRKKLSILYQTIKNKE